MEQEEFKKIDGWNGRYSIGTLGTVISNSQLGSNPIKHKVTKQGYHYVSLYTGLKSPRMKSVGVSRLMAAAFIPNPNDWSEVEFIDGDKDNLRVDNLKWVIHNPSARRRTGYRYYLSHKDDPNSGWILTSLKQICDITGMYRLSVANHLLRHPGEPGRSGWIITQERIPNDGYDRAKSL